MNFNLRMLNCWIGLCRGVPPLPADIAIAGYTERGIERGFRTTQQSECKPELMCGSRQQRHAILWEWKDGRGIDLSQLRRYAALTTADLVERAFLPSEECHKHDTILLVKEENVRNTIELLDREELPFVIVGAYPGRFKLARGEIQGNRLSGILADFACEWESAPVSFVPLDRDSPIEEIARHVITLLLQRMLQRQSVIQSWLLCEDVCPLYPAMGQEARNDVEAKITEVFAAAAEHEFSPYLSFAKQSSGKSTLTVIKSPFDLGDDKRSRAFRKMRRLQGEFLEAVTSGHRPPPPPSLFDPV